MAARRDIQVGDIWAHLVGNLKCLSFFYYKDMSSGRLLDCFPTPTRSQPEVLFVRGNLVILIRTNLGSYRHSSSENRCLDLDDPEVLLDAQDLGLQNLVQCNYIVVIPF